MGELIFQVEQAVEGGYIARALGASIFAEAEDLEALREQVRDAVRCHFEEGKGPKVINLSEPPAERAVDLSISCRVATNLKPPATAGGSDLLTFSLTFDEGNLSNQTNAARRSQRRHRRA